MAEPIRMYSPPQQIAGTMTGMQEEFQNQSQLQQAQLANQMRIAQLPWNFRQGIFNQIFPYAKNVLGSVFPSLGFGNPNTGAPGTTPGQPGSLFGSPVTGGGAGGGGLTAYPGGPGSPIGGGPAPQGGWGSQRMTPPIEINRGTTGTGASRAGGVGGTGGLLASSGGAGGGTGAGNAGAPLGGTPPGFGGPTSWRIGGGGGAPPGWTGGAPGGTGAVPPGFGGGNVGFNTGAPGVGNVPLPGGAPGLPSPFVMNPMQTEASINAQQAQNAAQAAAGGRETERSTAGKGFGANSPLSQELAGRFQAQRMAQNEEARRQTTEDVAKLNAQQALGVGGLANQLYGSQLGAATQQYMGQLGQQNAIFQAIMGMLGSIA
jgi:hypothetical protein